MKDRRPFVAVMMGSDSDWPVMQSVVEVLERLEVETEVRIASAHRTPAATSAYVEEASGRGCAVFIAGAGMAAHLAGAVAAHTNRPVIGVPLESSGPLAGMDALLSTVQMPPGFPVATVAVGKAGATNAGISRRRYWRSRTRRSRAALPRTGRSGPERFRTRTPRCSASSAPERPGHVRGRRAGARPSAACSS